MGRVWAYLGENLDSISDKDKEMLVNLRKSGKFTRKEIISFNKSLVAQQYDEELLNCAVDMHKTDARKTVKEWYAYLENPDTTGVTIPF